MQKIISIKPTQILSGLTPFKQNASYGIWDSIDGLNPAISGGGISLSASPIDISQSVIAGNIQAFVGSTSYGLFGYDNNGNFYKITDLDAVTPTVVNLKSGSPVANAFYWGLENLITKAANRENILYFSKSYAGLYLPATGVFADTKWALTNGNYFHPVFRVADRVYFGDQNYLSMLYDDTVNNDPAISQGWFILPKNEMIVGLSHDGTYLVIGADAGSDSRLETVIYFYDADNHYDYAIKRYTIQDKLVKLYTKKGITYALCTGGLWAFSLGSAPQKITEAISADREYPNIVDQSVDALLIGGNSVITSYGKLSPEFPNGRFNPVSDINGTVTAIYAQESNTRLYFGSSQGKLYYCDYYTQRVCTDDVVKTAYIDLSSYVSIDQIDLIYQDILTTGDSAQVRARATESGVEGIAYSDFSTASYASEGGVNSSATMVLNSSGKVVTDKVSLEITLNGVCVIKQIDIYGSEKTR